MTKQILEKAQKLLDDIANIDKRIKECEAFINAINLYSVESDITYYLGHKGIAYNFNNTEIDIKSLLLNHLEDLKTVKKELELTFKDL